MAAGSLGLRLLGMHNLLPLDGGLPLIVDGEVVGAIGVSGMQSTQDAQVAAAGVAALAGEQDSAPIRPTVRPKQHRG